MIRKSSEALGANQSAFGRSHQPFTAVGVVARFPDRIVRDDVEDQVLPAVVGYLVGLPGGVDEGIAGFD